MHVLTRRTTEETSDPGAIEELEVPPRLLAWLSAEAYTANPHMPATFGVPAMIRLLIERIESLGVDLAEARCETDIVRLVTDAMSKRRTV